MADSPAALIPPSTADPPKAKIQTLLRIHLLEPTLSLGDLFVGVYEHLRQLREGGYHAAADEMDNSQSVSRLVQIASGDGWQSFDTAWSAKEFREILYNAIAPDEGGPLWFRESLREPILGDICTTQIPHVRLFSGFEILIREQSRAYRKNRCGKHSSIRPGTRSPGSWILNRRVTLTLSSKSHSKT